MRKKMTNQLVERPWKIELHDEGEKKGQPKIHQILWDTEVKGFGLRYFLNKDGEVTTRTYFLQCRVGKNGKMRVIKIGIHNDTHRVDQARAEAFDLKARLMKGYDPVEEKAKQEEAERQQKVLDAGKNATLRQVMEHYLIHRRTKYGPLREGTKQSIREKIEKNLAAWLDEPMAATITRDACLVRFTELSDTEVQKNGTVGKKGTANMVFAYLRALCNHAREMYAKEDGEPTIFLTNPVTRMVKVRKLNPGKVRKGRIPRERIGAVWNELRRRAVEARRDKERTAADWISMILLTGTRLTESGSLKKTQVDLEAKTITLMGDVSKNHRELVLPTSTVLHDILSTRLTTPLAPSRRRIRARSTEHVFPGGGKKKPYIHDARSTMDAISKVAGRHLSYHDLRRTFEDILRYAKVDPDQRRILTNHVAGDVHQASYSNDDSADSLRPAMEAAAKWVLDMAKVAAAQASGANVVTLKTG
jgi:hypothetical protein